MATAKEYPVKIRKIPVLDKKTGITLSSRTYSMHTGYSTPAAL